MQTLRLQQARLTSSPHELCAAGGALDIDALRAAHVSDDSGAQTVDEAIAEVAGSVRENIQLRRAYRCVVMLSLSRRSAA